MSESVPVTESQVLSEAAVREEIIAPILRALHYSSTGENEIRYELPLRYPRDYLGRKKPDTDPVIRGRSDYICSAGRKVNWIVEAKASGTAITTNDIEQAYTYAKHPEVRAVYFCLCNGLEFRVYVTDGAPAQDPILVVDPTNRRLAVRRLRELLAPDALLYRFAQAAASALPPIGAGLLSYTQIVQGWIAHERSTPSIPHMRGFTVTITGGAIQRASQGLCAYWESRAPYTAIQGLIDRIGLTRVEALSSDSHLSSDRQAPTLFCADMSAVFPKGEIMPNLVSGESNVLAYDLHCHLTFRAWATLEGNVIDGPFQMEVVYEVPGKTPRPEPIVVATAGKFEFRVR
jgi:hypothetical protein